MNKKVILRSYKNLEILFKETYEYLKIFNKLCQSMCCKRKKSNSYSNLIRQVIVIAWLCLWEPATQHKDRANVEQMFIFDITLVILYFLKSKLSLKEIQILKSVIVNNKTLCPNLANVRSLKKQLKFQLSDRLPIQFFH